MEVPAAVGLTFALSWSRAAEEGADGGHRPEPVLKKASEKPSLVMVRAVALFERNAAVEAVRRPFCQDSSR